jgi:hypothetical protein
LNAFLRAADATGDSTYARTALCGVWPSVDDCANRTSNNGATNRTTSNFFSGTNFIGIGLALFLVGVIPTHIDTFTVDNGLINEWTITHAPTCPKAQSKH